MTIKHPEYHRKAIETYRSLFRPDILELYRHVRSTGDKDMKDATDRHKVACDIYQELHGHAAHLKLISKAYQQYLREMNRRIGLLSGYGPKAVPRLRTLDRRECRPIVIFSYENMCTSMERRGRVYNSYQNYYNNVRVRLQDIQNVRSSVSNGEIQIPYLEERIKNMNSAMQTCLADFVSQNYYRIEYHISAFQEILPVLIDALQMGWITVSEIHEELTCKRFADE